MFAEILTRRFWPLWSIAFVVLAALMLGVQDSLALEVTWLLALACGVGFVVCAVRGVWKFVWPTRDDAIARLDATLPGRPIQALRDQPVMGTSDPGALALWKAHQERMTRGAMAAHPVTPDLRISKLDPFGLRFIATLALAVAMLFGSIHSVSSVRELSANGAALASGPTWEGWIEPPSYTQKPALYLNDQPEGVLELPEGSVVLLRLYGEVGALTVAETVSGRVDVTDSAAQSEQSFSVTQSGEVSVAGPGGAKWDFVMVPDGAPIVQVVGSAEASARGEMTVPFSATDDYGVVAGTAVIRLDLSRVDRKYGLAPAPEDRGPVTVELPLPISGSRAEFEAVLIEDLSKHPWAHLPVTALFSVQDDTNQVGTSDPLHFDLPAQHFFDPLATAVVELRRDLLWSRENGARVANLMRAVSYRPEDGVFPRETDYLRFRTILRRLDMNVAHGLSVEKRDEFAEALWQLALHLEDGDLGSASERLRRAQERLSEAMKNGASDAEIAELMQELRDATEAYMRELAKRDQQGDEESNEAAENSMQLDQNDLQRMMDRIQELMEQGRMAEAQQALEELQRLMENMQVTQGEGETTPGEQAMEGLADTLREQQGLSDEAFRELQEQFNPDAQAGQSQGNQGYNGGEGRGQAHDGTGGEGQGEGEEGQAQGSGEGESGRLEDRQQALRQELGRQLGNLPGQGTPEGDAASDALGLAERSMDDAAEALRQDDLAAAIDKQAEAMDALREGMRSLSEAMAEQQNPGQNGTAQTQGDAQDPLGRSPGNKGAAGTDEGLLQGEDVYRQARRLLDEIRRRSGESDRPDLERNYLERLLDRF